jgi:Ni2+-binding GTPase involved in maturation of urease and hydrogenase
MGKSADDYQAEYKIITIKTTDGSTIYGKINIGEKERVSDIFTINKSPFVVMVDASYKENVGKTMFINKKHIVWAEPEEL